MHLSTPNILLVLVGALSLAALAFFVAYILYEESARSAPAKRHSIAMTHNGVAFSADYDEQLSRPSFIVRAIGGEGGAQLRSFRAANLLLAVLPTAWLLHRERLAAESAHYVLSAEVAK